MMLVVLALGFASAVERGSGGKVFKDGAGTYLQSFPGAFTREECALIEAAFVERSSVEVDERVGEGISRVNRWLPQLPAEMNWVLERVLQHLPADDPFWGFEGSMNDPVAFLEKRLDFTLMHEFTSGRFFDWHVDTKPNDGTTRTLNVNVVLSPTSAFEGGELQVADQNVTLGIGDLHIYPASCPHKVHDIKRGLRRTLVLAVRAAERGGKAAGTAAERGGTSAGAAYWTTAGQRYASLCELSPKLHWIFGEYLEAIGDEKAAMAKFGDSYAATPQKGDYLAALTDEAAALHEADDLDGAARTLQICAAMEPGEPSHAADLGIVLWKLRRLADSEAALRRALAAEEVPSQKAAIHAALALVLKDSSKPALAEKELRAAFAADKEVAQAALEHLKTMKE